MIDVFEIEKLDDITEELHEAGLRLNQTPPDVVMNKKGFGGILISSTVPLTYLSESMIRSIASEYVINAQITIREDLTESRLIDAFSENRLYLPAIVVVNKIDLVSPESIVTVISNIEAKGWYVVGISASKNQGINQLKKLIK